MKKCANGETGDNNFKSNLDQEYKVSGFGVRHKQCLLLFGVLNIAYGLRVCIGMALVGMVKDVEIHTSLNSSDVYDRNETHGTSSVNSSVVYSGNETQDLNRGDSYVPNGFFNTLLLTPPYPHFDWDKKTQNSIVLSFFIGYMLLQVPAGQLIHRFGAKKLLAGAMIINSVASIFFPVVTYYGGWIAAAALRMAQGMSQACIVPSVHTFLGKWTPLEERGRLSGLIYGALALGPVIALPLTGFIAASPLGWPGIFRFYGILAGIFGAIVWFFCADSPAQHKHISAAERNYIEDCLKQKGDANKKPLKVPWGRLLTHRGVYAIIVAHVSKTWTDLILNYEVPAYMDKIMGVNIKVNGLLSALPYFLMWLTNFFFSWFFDMLIVKKYISVTSSRKLAQTLGSISTSVGFIILAYVPKDIYVVESVMVVLCSLSIATHTGFMVNHIDISPNFAGTMMSLSNFTSNCIGCLAPIVTGIILTDVTSVYLWRQVFFIASGFSFVSWVIYMVFGTSELADWNDPKTQPDDEEAHAMLEKEPTKETIKD